MSAVIKVENLSKKYIIAHQKRERYLTLRDTIAQKSKEIGKRLLHPFLSTGQPLVGLSNTEEFWALKDVSFEINKGERVGIIGRNGAGKTTLLKILSRITEPTKGRVKIKGRVASLLEVGTGFHPELTGRENIFLNGAILGMGKEEIKKKFDEIVAFAEIEKFLDTPVKRYSSGMYVRLAFSVAAHLEPEILIIDEVLAVGDLQFQKKCMGKMEEVGREGRTVLFVSHNMTAVKSLCENAIWLESGHIMNIGNSDLIVSEYFQSGTNELREQTWENPDIAPGNDKVRLHYIRLAPDVKDHNDLINLETPLKIEIELWNLMSRAYLNFSLHLYTMEGTYVLATVSNVFAAEAGIVKGTCYIPGNFLNNGTYRVMIKIVQDSKISVLTLKEALYFEVIEDKRNSDWYGKWPGVVRPKFKWNVT
jgi:lipopolysaccharide transport system ATP-binding protein